MWGACPDDTDTGPAAQAGLLLRPISILLHLAPTLTLYDLFPPVLTPWPSPSTVRKWCLRVEFYLRVKLRKIKDVLAFLLPVSLEMKVIFLSGKDWESTRASKNNPLGNYSAKVRCSQLGYQANELVKLYKLIGFVYLPLLGLCRMSSGIPWSQMIEMNPVGTGMLQQTIKEDGLVALL